METTTLIIIGYILGVSRESGNMLCKDYMEIIFPFP